MNLNVGKMVIRLLVCDCWVALLVISSATFLLYIILYNNKKMLNI